MDTESERKEEGERSFNALRGDIDGAVRAVIEEKMINVAEYSLPKVKDNKFVSISYAFTPVSNAVGEIVGR